jgi:hypothetical protein
VWCWSFLKRNGVTKTELILDGENKILGHLKSILFFESSFAEDNIKSILQIIIEVANSHPLQGLTV